MKEIYKYSGAGNDFVVIDGRDGAGSEYSDPATISALCNRQSGFKAADGRTGADGLMVLHAGGEGMDFRMEYYNSDGSGGMMCGNGGRCITAFAHFLGISPADGKTYRFLAADGLHTGEILSLDGDVKIVRLKMIDCKEYRPALDGWFLDTGTRHFVKFVSDVEAVDIDSEGPRYRHDPLFSPLGANANFVAEAEDGRLFVRTFEKGVEAETLACGTGITASAIAAWLRKPGERTAAYAIRARRDDLRVEFRSPDIPGGAFTEVYLTGPAELIR